MKVYRAYNWTRTIWLVGGEPLPPPQRGTHWLELEPHVWPPVTTMNVEDWGRSIAGYLWSRGLD